MLAPASVRLTIRARAAGASVTSLPSEKRSGSGLSFVAATQLVSPVIPSTVIGVIAVIDAIGVTDVTGVTAA